jgi:hypothetical protein
MAKERTLESRIKEHKRFREQCRRRIRPYFTLFLAAAIVLIAIYFFRPFSPWVFVGVLGFSAGNLALEIFGYRFHDRKLKELQ